MLANKQLLTKLVDIVLADSPTAAIREILKLGIDQLQDVTWQKLYISAFQEVVNELKGELKKYASVDGEIGIDVEALERALVSDLLVTAEMTSLSQLDDPALLHRLSLALAKRQGLIIGGHNLTEEEYLSIVENAVDRTRTKFREAILRDQLSYRSAVLKETQGNRELLQKIEEYLETKFQIVVSLLKDMQTSITNLELETQSQTLLLKALRDDLAHLGTDPFGIAYKVDRLRISDTERLLGIDSNIIEKYLEDCDAFLLDMQLAIEDLEFLIEGGEIYYAIDFSEIFSYLFPRASNTGNFALFQSEDNSSYSMSFERSLLAHLFTSRKYKLILLSPYNFELNHFISSAENHLIYNSLNAISETVKLKSDPEFEKYLQLSELRELSPDEKKAVILYIEEQAPTLVHLAYPLDKPLTELSRMFKEGVFSELDDETIDDGLRTRWHSKLLIRRGRMPNVQTPSLIDSTAMSIVSEYNNNRSSNGERLLLVTRSKLMFQILKEDMDEGLWPTERNFIRHPRYFMIFERGKSASYQSLLNDISSDLEGLKGFLGLARSADTLDHVELSSRVNELVMRLIDIWNSNRFLSLSVEEAVTYEQYQDRRTPDVRRIMKIIREQNGVADLILDRIDELSAVVQDLHIALGIAISAREIEPVNINLLDIPMLNWQMPKVQSFLSAFRLVHDNHWRVILDYFRNIELEDSQRSIEHEEYLALAYSLGQMGYWQMAEMFSRRAEERNESVLPTHQVDIVLMSAVCRRKLNPTLSRHLEAINTLERILKDVANDPSKANRLLLERTIHVIHILVFYGQENRLSEIPSHNEIIATLDQLEEHFQEQENNQAMVQVYNYRLFCFLNLSQLERKDLLIKYHEILRSLLENTEPDMNKWPSILVDTIVWGCWLLREETIKNHLIKQLDIASNRQGSSKNEQMLIREHLRVIRSSLAN